MIKIPIYARLDHLRPGHLRDHRFDRPDLAWVAVGELHAPEACSTFAGLRSGRLLLRVPATGGEGPDAIFSAKGAVDAGKAGQYGLRWVKAGAVEVKGESS